MHLIQCKHLNCLGKKDYSRVTPSIRKWSRLFIVIILPFLLFSEVKFFGRCSVRYMLNYFHLCVFDDCVRLCMGSSYCAESDTMSMLETKGSLKFGTSNLNYIGKGKGKCRWKPLKQKLFSKSWKRESWRERFYLKIAICLQNKEFGGRKMSWYGREMQEWVVKIYT